jgi:hypothetical protein
MVIPGRVHNGVVVLDSPASLPEGTEVTVSVCAPINGERQAMSDVQRRRYVEALVRIDALADENPSDTFSGADHDQILYGETQ